MHRRLKRLFMYLLRAENHGVSAPRIFTDYELKLLSALSILALALMWSLARTGAQEGVLGLVLICGLSIYLSYGKYYCTYKPEMDRWRLRELVHPEHPRQELRVADRDILVSEDEIKMLGRQHGVNIVVHRAPDKPHVLIYELEPHYEHRMLAHRFHSAQRK